MAKRGDGRADVRTNVITMVSLSCIVRTRVED